MLPLIGLMNWFRREERTSAVTVATYVVMLLASLLLGFLVSRFFSEPLNRRLRGAAGQDSTARLPRISSTNCPP
jgi:peptidoglycan/LPS O-acetylase OafA/YrhL